MRSRFLVVLKRAGDFMIVLVSKVQVRLAMRICPLSTSQAPSDLAKPSGILLIQLYDTVGDVMFTSPLIRELAQGFPDCKLTVAVSAHGVSGLLDKNPHIADIIAVDVRCHKWLRPLLLPWRHWLLARRKLKQRGFDVAIIPRSSVDYCYATFLAYFSGAPCRVGYTEKMDRRKSILNRNWDQLLTVLLPPLPTITNEVLLNLNVLSAFGKSARSDRTEIWTSSEDRQFASAALEYTRRRRVCISPTCGHSELKQWGIHRFAELAGELVRHSCDVVLVGSPQDKPLGYVIEERLNGGFTNLIGKTSIREMAAAVSNCDIYVGNDAGPAHVASAMGVPTITIFGSSCHHQFAPWGQRNRVITMEFECGPCGSGHHIDRCTRCIYEQPKCLHAITVEKVLSTVLSMLLSLETIGTQYGSCDSPAS